MIKLKNVSKYYLKNKADKFYALNDVSLEFNKNEFVSILGPSGCGKSTLLNLLGGLDKASDGDVIIDDKKISELSSKELDLYKNQSVGFVFQNCFLISQLSVLENIILPLKVRGENVKEIKEKAINYLKKFNIESLKDKKVNELSGGQAQKVCIIRAIISDSKLVLADEPTGALDSKSALEIMNVLKEISKEHLVIMVTHNDNLASLYSDRIIRLFDGKIQSDETINSSEENSSKKNTIEKKSNHLSFLITFKMAIKNLISKKWKSIVTSISNSLGVIGIGFFLALNLGFSNYTNRISKEQASSLPVVLSSYAVNSSREEFSKVNASIEYPSATEIYPSVSLASTYSYRSNKFTNKYFSYLNSLQNEGILREYVLSYGSSYSFNLATEFPTSIDGNGASKISTVSTSVSSYNYYASNAYLPTNIFHVLYGDLSSYDLIAGSMPTDENELVLVVNKYNAVSFNILKNLGFYNLNDKEDDVKTNDEKKIKSISFEDVLAKEYKIFTNDEFYSSAGKKDINDALINRQIDVYEANDINNLYNDESKGIKLKIKGILRPKSTTAMNILSPALCYLPSLQTKLMNENENSALSKSFETSFALKKNQDGNEIDLLTKELTDLYNKYQSDDSDVFPVNSYNDIINKYFTFYVPYDSRYVYTSLTAFLNSSKQHSSNLISDDLIALSLSQEEIQTKLFEIILKINNDNKTLDDVLYAYKEFISLSAIINAYSLIETVVLFPSDLNQRAVLISKLDSFNEIDENNVSNHAKNEGEQVIYQTENNNDLIDSVKEAVVLANIILVMVATISFVVSIFMTSLMISNNVLERQKEIGLLRAIGTSKISVSSIFVFEAMVIGLVSGIIGSIATYVFSFPINSLVNKTYPSYRVGQIANFTYYHALIIILVSIVVSLISSFIPAYLAAKNDPIKSLRTE